MTGDAERAETIAMIADSAAFMASRDTLARARALRGTVPGFDRTVWARAAEQGWLGLRVAEPHGGVDLGVQELCALAEALGRGLAPEPLAAAICAARLLDADGAGDFVAGRSIVLPAWQDDDAGPTTRLAAGRLTGAKRFVYMGAGADRFLVTTDQGLALVDSDAPGVAIATAALQDGGHFATLRFEDAPATALGGTLDDALEEMTVATSAYLLGVMRAAFAMMLDYLRTRRQFGRLIGSFQALQHRSADLHVQIELTGAAVQQAAIALDGEADSAARRRAVSRAKARAGEAAMLVTKQGIQLHGGIGFTDEADIGLCLRKAMTMANMHGSAAFHRLRYAGALPQVIGEHRA